MSDRRSDQGAPLFPRRTLTGPSGSPEAPPDKPQETPREAREARKGRPRRSGTSTARRGVDGGPPTAAMPRVDEQEQQQDQRPDPSAPDRSAPAQHAAPPPFVTGAQSRTQPAKAAARSRGMAPRKARLRIVRLDPWSVMKMAFALSIALAIITVIAVAIVWSVLDAAGVWEAINTSLNTLTNANAGSAIDVEEYVGLGRVMGLTMVIAAANIVLLTALATLGAFLYNLAASLLGGFEVTLAEDR